mmetsp:Transcript_15304/g.44243  ORF Transcript_15304/g.44243 Transcript_15304/m.44243 type:complete len:242 (-) Transcript_15304:99-824(-)
MNASRVIFPSAPPIFLIVRRCSSYQIAKGGRVDSIDVFADHAGEGLVGILPLLFTLFAIGGIQRIVPIGIRGADEVDVPRNKGLPGNGAGAVRIEDGQLLILLVAVEAFTDHIEEIVEFGVGERSCTLGNLIVSGPCGLGDSTGGASVLIRAALSRKQIRGRNRAHQTAKREGSGRFFVATCTDTAERNPTAKRGATESCPGASRTTGGPTIRSGRFGRRGEWICRSGTGRRGIGGRTCGR